MTALNKSLETAYELAKTTRLKAYAPYSKFLVGVTVKAAGEEKYFSGCNVENASYGGTVCAERIAIFKWITERKNLDEKLDFLMLVTDTNPVAVPCAFCLQVISEFCSAEFPIHVRNLEGDEKVYLFKELLPAPFDKKSL